MIAAAGNRRANLFFTVDGVTKHLTSWARFYGVTCATLRYRLSRNNMDITKCLYTKKDDC